MNKKLFFALFLGVTSIRYFGNVTFVYVRDFISFSLLFFLFFFFFFFFLGGGGGGGRGSVINSQLKKSLMCDEIAFICILSVRILYLFSPVKKIGTKE